METPLREDPEIVLRREFGREDREDSRSLRWSLLAALVAHGLALSVVLPAAEVTDDGPGDFVCSIRPSKGIYARPAVPPTAPIIVPRPVEDQICRLFSDPPLDDAPDPLLELELELEGSPPPRVEPPPFARDLGVTPRLIVCVEPTWTEISRRARIQGVVILEIVIREDGAVADPKVLKGLPFGLDESAVEAVSQWRYEPIVWKGEPVAVRHVATVNFQRDRPSCPE